MFLKNVKLVSFYGKRAILSSNSSVKIPKRNSYLVLVPEIGEDLPGKYPLLKEDRTPEFNNVTIEKCIAAVGRQALDFENEIKTIEKEVEKIQDVTPEKLFQIALNPIEEMSTSLKITCAIADILYAGNNCLMPTECYIGIHNRAKRALAARNVSVPIYQACKSLLNNKEIKLKPEHKKIFKNYVLEGRLNGLELDKTDRLILGAIVQLSQKKTKEYSEKLQLATKQFKLLIRDESIMRDFPKEALRLMVKDESQCTTGPWLITLNPLIVKSLMECCPDSSVRWTVWKADVTKASVLQDKIYQASTLLEEIRHKRQQKAEKLGYKHFAELSMETKMAGTVENIYQTIDILLKTARPAQLYELTELNDFAKKNLVNSALQLWDIPFWSRKQLLSKHK